MGGLRERGLVNADGWFTDVGREATQRIEALTDELEPHHRDTGGRGIAVSTAIAWPSETLLASLGDHC